MTVQRSYFAIAAGFAVLAAFAGNALAASQETNLRIGNAADLADFCATPRSEPTGAERLNFCHGYAQGALTTELRHENATGKKRICMPNPAPPREVTMGEFVKWVRSAPKNQTMVATDGLFTFLSERFPCK